MIHFASTFVNHTELAVKHRVTLTVNGSSVLKNNNEKWKKLYLKHY